MMITGANKNLVRKRRLKLDYRDNMVENLIQRAKTQPEIFSHAEIFDGKYPDSLAVKTLTLSSQIEAFVRSGTCDFIVGKTQNQLLQELGQGCMNLEFTAIFYGILASENKAVAYYGDKVTAENPDAVLMRWRQDDGRYGVIFGDLTIKKVTEAALAELEDMPIIKDLK